jgi:sporulation protein YlmC with PRC-barrel domain
MRLFPAAAVVLALAASPLVLVQTTSSQTTTPAPGGSAQPQWYSHQAGEMRASKLIGTRVNNEAGERIGEVNEIVLSKDGKVAAVIIGVGGFLGMGEHEVAVKFESLRLTQDANNNTIVAMSATKDSLKAAPEWRWSGEGAAPRARGRRQQTSRRNSAQVGIDRAEARPNHRLCGATWNPELGGDVPSTTVFANS